MLELLGILVIVIISSMIIAWVIVSIEEFFDNHKRRRDTLELINTKIDRILFKVDELYFKDKSDEKDS